VQLGIPRHKGLNGIEIVGIDCLLELADFVERINVHFQLWPTGETVAPRNLELGVCDRLSDARPEQILGLVL
jgi:hypothetical protein